MESSTKECLKEEGFAFINLKLEDVLHLNGFLKP